MNRREFESERNRIEMILESAKTHLLMALRDPNRTPETVAIADEALRDAIERLMTLTAARAKDGV